MGHLLSHIDVTTQKENQFATRNIYTLEDLVEFFPKRYHNFQKVTPIIETQDGESFNVKGRVFKKEAGSRMNKVLIKDDAGNRMSIVFFGTTYFYDKLNIGDTWFFCGQVKKDIFGESITNPIIITQSEKKACHIMPVYPKIKGMSQEYLSTKITEAISFMRVLHCATDKESLAKSYNLMRYADALQEIHTPTDGAIFTEAKKRIDFDHIYDFYADMYEAQKYRQIVIPVPAPIDTKTQQFIKALPFQLTKGQTEAIQSIISDAKANKHVNVIVTGDVGCGKTEVAIIASYFVAENKLQTAVMAPTLVLAKQHFEEFSKQLAPLGVRIALLTSETKKAERNNVLAAVAAGEIDVLVGTHSILSTEIKFKTLGMTILDEEHKFGVAQKEILESFDKLGAHHVSMTATPIPRSYALAVYGDTLNVLPILDMPKGRKQIITNQFSDMDEVFEKVYTEISLGHQAYIVTPFIEDSEYEAFKDITSIRSMVDKATIYFKKHHPAVRIDSIDGGMKQKDIVSVIDNFAAGNFDILISTTIVEVGVNVPNATAIVIMDADRFGLAGLHQLRGRVGRKGDQGYCLLVSGKQSEKLDIMCRCSSGFEIAEKDSLLRGPGDLVGEKQTGSDSLMVINTILKRPKMAASIRAVLSVA